MKPETKLETWLQAVGAGEAFTVLAGMLHDQAVFVVNAERDVLYWSPGAEKLLGFRAEDIVGRHCLKASRCVACMSGCGIYDHRSIDGTPLDIFKADGGTARVRKWARGFFSPEGAFLGGIEVLEPAPVAVQERPAAAPILTLPDREGEAETFHGMLTRDGGMRDVFRLIENVARSDAPVLVRGESGTGKELVARALHERGERREGPFLAINCAAVAPGLLESELFGHVKGAFTGAVREHKGVFERAHGGTLFLDEVAELPLELQAKLLRVLQEMTFFRVGGTEPVRVDVRIVSATHRSLRAEVAAGRFRADLMYRLRVVPIFLPPLRDRRIDIPILINHFTALLNERGHRRIERVSPEAMRLLLDYGWPGNIRELKNVLEYAFAVGQGPELEVRDLPPELSSATGFPAPARVRADLPLPDERAAIEEALKKFNGHVGKAAESLGMSRPTFWRKRKRYGI